MRIAVVGSGVAGLVSAWLLRRRHEVTLFEADDRIGGHVHTVPVVEDGRAIPVDTGFIVFNRRTYPNFCRLLEQLGVAAQASDMSFAVSCARSGVEWNGSTIGGLFAQRRNLLSPGFHRMWIDILRFNRLTRAWLAAGDEMPLGEACRRAGLGRRFWDHYLVPLTAAVWSMAPEQVEAFPARFLARFLDNHGMNSVDDRPQWLTVAGGSWSYVQALIRPFARDIRLATPVRRVLRDADGVTVATDQGPERFDAVVLASHSDQTLALLGDPDDAERAVLGAIPYRGNRVVLHTDESRLPRLRRAWAAWNVRLPAAPGPLPELTYWMNRLQRLDSRRTYAVTLNPWQRPAGAIRSLEYAHPQFGTGSPAAQARWREINGVRRTWFAGAYWGNGFHEDGVVSALRVAADFGESL
jgi:predicted NAD/FAD-binding protein